MFARLRGKLGAMVAALLLTFAAIVTIFNFV